MMDLRRRVLFNTLEEDNNMNLIHVFNEHAVYPDTNIVKYFRRPIVTDTIFFIGTIGSSSSYIFTTDSTGHISIHENTNIYTKDNYTGVYISRSTYNGTFYIYSDRYEFIQNSPNNGRYYAQGFLYEIID